MNWLKVNAVTAVLATAGTVWSPDNAVVYWSGWAIMLVVSGLVALKGEL